MRLSAQPPEDERLRDIALLCARRHHSRYFIAFEDRVKLAWEGVVTAALENAVVSRGELVKAGLNAITAEVTAWHHHHGVPMGTQTGAKFQKYWHNPDGSPYDQVDEAIALSQVWRALGDRHRESLIRLINGEPETQNNIFLARQRARQLWFDHETEPGLYRAGRQVRQRHRKAARGRHGI